MKGTHWCLWNDINSCSKWENKQNWGRENAGLKIFMRDTNKDEVGFYANLIKMRWDLTINGFNKREYC